MWTKIVQQPLTWQQLISACWWGLPEAQTEHQNGTKNVVSWILNRAVAWQTNSLQVWLLQNMPRPLHWRKMPCWCQRSEVTVSKLVRDQREAVVTLVINGSNHSIHLYTSQNTQHVQRQCICTYEHFIAYTLHVPSSYQRLVSVRSCAKYTQFYVPLNLSVPQITAHVKNAFFQVKFLNSV